MVRDKACESREGVARGVRVYGDQMCEENSLESLTESWDLSVKNVD